MTIIDFQGDDSALSPPQDQTSLPTVRVHRKGVGDDYSPVFVLREIQ
jgi:hypothetical protein